MVSGRRPGVVIFTGEKDRLATFYEAVASLAIDFSDEAVTVLGSDEFELVIHALPQEAPVGPRPLPREDCYLKPFFPVASLAAAREKAAALGGQLRPQHEEWAWQGFRACEATDPDGNVIQFREDAG